jgi:GTPase SAR1 family protein
MALIQSLTEIVSPLVPSAIKHLAYPFTMSINIKYLESATRELVALKEDAKTEITNAERTNGVPTKQAEEWLGQIDIIEKEAEEIREKHQQLCRCIFNISPNLCSRYKISRSAAKKLVEVKSLCTRRETIEVIVQMPPPLFQEMPASASKSSSLEQALQYIKDDTHAIIGIWGMGGVGKTHLLEQVNNELARDREFHVVVFLTCSKQCSEEKVQLKIIEKFGLSKSDDEEQRKTIIFHFLQEKSFVLLLDDLWNHVDLKKIGIPDLVGKKKVVLTTRSIEVCRKMEARRNIKVPVLNWDDAWSLFTEKVTEDTINSHPLITTKYAKEIVEELGGLPLALLTVGRAMYDKRDPSRWEHAVTRLRQARLDEVSEESVFRTLSFSYENLDNETLRQCFLHCALWPEDSYISKKHLIKLWMGLGLIDEHDVPSAYNVGSDYIGKLQDACLFEKYGEDCIKLHDVIRDMALWIARNQGVDNFKWIVEAGTHKERQLMIKVPHDTEKLSLMHNGIEKLFFSLPYPSSKLSTLLLCYNRLNDLETFRLESFCELRVLDLSGNCFDTFPVEICKLVHLQFLNLSYDCRINCKSLPKELGHLINLKYLLLRGMRCSIAKGVISKLKALRVLDAWIIQFSGEEENFRRFESLEKEIKHLSDFQALQISIIGKHDFEDLSQTSVPIRKLKVYGKYKGCLSFSSCFLGNPQLQKNLEYLELISLGPVKWVKFERSTSYGQRICQLGRLERLSFHSIAMKKVIWKGINPRDVFPKLQNLSFVSCDRLKSISWVICLPCIQELLVFGCPSIKQLISINELSHSGIIISQPSLPALKKMTLFGNRALKRISDPMVTFPALEYVKVFVCNKLKKLPFKTGNPPKILVLEGTQDWWNNIEMEDSSHRSLLQPFFKEW